MHPAEFERHRAEGHTRIPLARELVSDLDTPSSIYLKLADRPYTFLFESVQGGERLGRHSIIGLPARTVVRVHGNEVAVETDGVERSRERVDDPLAWIEDYQRRFRVPRIAGLPRITGGLVGYFGYDTVRHVESRLGSCTRPDPIGTPDILLMVAEELVVFDNVRGTLVVLVLVDPETPDAHARGLARLEALHDGIRAALPRRAASPDLRRVEEADFESGFSEADYKAAVGTIKRHIVEGDCMQVVLSQRMTVPYEAPPFDLYRALRLLNPSPYLFHLDLGDHHVIGSSPEILTRIEDGEIAVRPLAGTRPRGGDEAEDRAHEASLLADPKELAEHLMLIDLGRNDVGRVAETGSVAVTERFAIERYSHVMHIVSNVVGRLRAGLSPIDVLRATFPAGTLSGAPKVRAMEIIDALEPVKRGVYGGAVGYLSWNGDMDTAIAIRTAVLKDGLLNVQAGAGIVHDSDPDSEWQETLNKARAVFRAVALAEGGRRVRARRRVAGVGDHRRPGERRLDGPCRGGGRSARRTGRAPGETLVIAVIDNYDSFTWNLVQYLRELGAEVEVYRNDAIGLEALAATDPRAVLVSPGPGTPDGAGISLGSIPRFAGRVPLLGVCLGHQSIGQHYGGRVGRAREIMHGKLSLVHHAGQGVFAGLPSPFTATRYHSPRHRARLRAGRARGHPPGPRTSAGSAARSWACATASTRSRGVQFHPESISSEHGHRLLGNFLASAGLAVADPAREAFESTGGRMPAASPADRPVRGRAADTDDADPSGTRP